MSLFIGAAGVFFTADIPLASLMHLTRHMYSPEMGMAGKIVIAVITRPAPLILLVASVFYLWVYSRRTRANLGARQA